MGEPKDMKDSKEAPKQNDVKNDPKPNEAITDIRKLANGHLLLAHVHLHLCKPVRLLICILIYCLLGSVLSF